MIAVKPKKVVITRSRIRFTARDLRVIAAELRRLAKADRDSAKGLKQ